MHRGFIFAYAVVAYLFGVLGILTIVLAIPGAIAWGFLLANTSSVEQMSAPMALLVNVALVTGWGVIHSIMARPKFKQWLTRSIPEPAERATYVLVAGVTSILLVGFWQAVPGTLWSFEHGAVATAIWGLWLFGWVFLLASTFAINHYDLFGLRQAYYHLKNKERPPLKFVKRAMYLYVRHPIQTGVLIGVWALPTMSATQLILSLGFTVYIAVGLRLEEKELIQAHGQDYLTYKQETGWVFPKLR